MRKRRVLFIVTVFCLVCGYLGAAGTGAWFISGGNFGTGIYQTAVVQYLPSLTPTTAEIEKYGSLTSEPNLQFIVPGDQLLCLNADSSVKPLRIENFSTAETSVRSMINTTLYSLDDNSKEVYVDGLVWRNVGTNKYQLGKNVDIVQEGVTKNVFMGLIEVEAAETDLYKWSFGSGETSSDPDSVSFDFFWDLVIKGSPDSMVIPEKGDIEQIYDVIKSVSVVTNGLTADYQSEYDDYYSKEYSGNFLKINISYYARQTGGGMVWSDFSKTELSISLP